ncbi:MAG: GNAT family N-acetyltransferase [Planctomycetota bacterium]
MAKNADKSDRTVLPVRFELKDGRAGVLRNMVEDDAEELCRLLPQTHTESDFLNYQPGEFNMTVEQEREFIRDHHAKPGSFALVAEVDGRIVGFAGALSQQYKRLSHHAEFGLAVLKAYWGQGIGCSICQCIEDWGIGVGLRKMYLRVFANNDRGIALYKSLGYVEEGRLKDDVLRGDGTYGDTIIMAKFFAD